MRSWLAGRALRATHVLVVPAPGRLVAVAVEREVRRRGWRVALAPASADLLVTVGEPSGELAGLVDRVWDSMPGPRARCRVDDPADLAAGLDHAARRLTDREAQARDARERDPLQADTGDMDHEMDHDMGHDMDHDDMGDMDMAPNGIPLAEGTPDDRDGLEMDALPVRLGPLLPCWPAGLVVEATLHGDLVVEASSRLVDGVQPTTRDEPADPALDRAMVCDDVVELLTLAGADRVADLAREARDALLDGDQAHADAALDRLHRQVRGSRALTWSLRDVGRIDPERARDLGYAQLAGDCLDRLHAQLDRARAHPSPARPRPDGGYPRLAYHAVGPLLAGHELAAARLLVASLGGSALRSEVAQHA